MNRSRSIQTLANHYLFKFTISNLDRTFNWIFKNCSKLLKFFLSLLDSSRPFSFGKWTNIWYWNAMNSWTKKNVEVSMERIRSRFWFYRSHSRHLQSTASVDRMGRPWSTITQPTIDFGNNILFEFQFRKCFGIVLSRNWNFPNNVFPPVPRVPFIFFFFFVSVIPSWTIKI